MCCVTVITLFIKKVGVVRPNFGGPEPPDPPVVAPLIYHCCRCCVQIEILHVNRCLENISGTNGKKYWGYYFLFVDCQAQG